MFRRQIEPTSQSASRTNPSHLQRHSHTNSTHSPAWTHALGSQPAVSLQPKLTINQPGDQYEQEADHVASQVMQRQPTTVQCKADGIAHTEAPSSVHETLQSSGQPLDTSTRAFMEPRFGQDFSNVRLHTDSQAAQSAADVNARAYTVGQNIVFAKGQYAPSSGEGQHLLAHELTHTVQQNSTASSIQRIVEMRDVGRGEQSGFARLPELMTRINAISQGLTFSLNGSNQLTYTIRVGGTLSEFDRLMMGFIDQAALIPLRLTNRHGLLGSKATGFNTRVDVDAFTSGYVDIDDLLASDDLALQSVLLHFIRERTASPNYARRIGTNTFTQKEFDTAHALGIEAEAALLRDFFGDPSIHIVNDSPSPTVRRVFRNTRGDLIRRRVTIGRGADAGVDAMSIDVLTRDGKVHTAQEYRQILEAERAITAQVRHEELHGADEHREGGHGVPAP